MPSEVQPLWVSPPGWEKAVDGALGAVPPFCPERPAGPFSCPVRLPRKCPGGNGPHTGFLRPPGACPGSFPALRRRGHASCPVFSRPLAGRRRLPFCPERPAERFFRPGRPPQGGVRGCQARTRASCGPPGASWRVSAPPPPGSCLLPGFFPSAGGRAPLAVLPSEPRRAVFMPRAAPPRKCPGLSGLHTGFLRPPGACPGSFPALRRRGHASFPVFSRPPAGRRRLPFCPESPAERFSCPGRPPEVSGAVRPAHGLPAAPRGASRQFPGPPPGPFFPAPPPLPIFPALPPPPIFLHPYI